MLLGKKTDLYRCAHKGQTANNERYSTTYTLISWSNSRIPEHYTDTCHNPKHRHTQTYYTHTHSHKLHAHAHAHAHAHTCASITVHMYNKLTLTDSSTTMRIGTKAERVNVGFYLLQICGGIHQDVVEHKILLLTQSGESFQDKRLLVY